MSGAVLRFGIDTLDALLDATAVRLASKDPNSVTQAPDVYSGHPWTVAIQGPDGCGKSILALHLASNYWYEHCKPKSASKPAVVYVSTDLSHEQASAQWKAFGLDYPEFRKALLDHHYELLEGEPPTRPPEKEVVKLSRLSPVSVESQVEDCNEATREGLDTFFESHGETVRFVDLQSETAGDDWGWLNRFLSLLPTQKRAAPPHLLIVDAVEGLETMVGRRDAYGTARSRRSRIAQLIRGAANKRAHVVFVVEEPRPNARLPEQFVTDLVIRLRQRLDGDYSQRTIEIEKCRATAHVRGEHEFSIRTGHGTFTGDDQHLDNPEVAILAGGGKDEPPRLRSGEAASNSAAKAAKLKPLRYLAHIHVSKSLHRINREVREEGVPIPKPVGVPTFGLTPLDKLLGNRMPGGARIPVPDTIGSNGPSACTSVTPPDAEGGETRNETPSAGESEAQLTDEERSTTPEGHHERKTSAGDETAGSEETGDCENDAAIVADATAQESEVESTASAGMADGQDYASPNPPQATSSKTDSSKKETSHGSLVLILGDAGTHKGRLGRRFLSQAFQFKEGELVEKESGVAVLITTRMFDCTGLIESMWQMWGEATMGHVPQKDDPLYDSVWPRVLCQRLGTRHLTSPTFCEIVSTCIYHAQQFLLSKEPKESWRPLSEVEQMPIAKKWGVSGHIRLLIEDWSTLIASHPSLAKDSGLLSSLLVLLRRQGVNAAILSTQPGQPSIPVGAATKLDLRAIDETQVLTWPVQFFGERRVAITAVSGANEGRKPVIYELAPTDKCAESGQSSHRSGRGTTSLVSPSESTPTAAVIGAQSPCETLQVKEEFDLYRDIESGHPRPVPLKLRLFVGSYAPDGPSSEQLHFPRMLKDALLHLEAAVGPGHDFVTFDACQDYDSGFTFTTALDSSLLDHTLVLQVDEFWAPTDESPHLLCLEEYWDEKVSGPSFVPHKSEDEHPVRPLTVPETAFDNFQVLLDNYRSVNSGELTAEAGRKDLLTCIRQAMLDNLGWAVARPAKPVAAHPVETTPSLSEPEEALAQEAPQQATHVLPEESIATGRVDGAECGIAPVSTTQISPKIEERMPAPPITSRQEYRAATERRRASYFTSSRSNACLPRVDRIPYLWDFGMLVADRDVWGRYSSENGDEDTPERRIHTVWDTLCLGRSRLTDNVTDWHGIWWKPDPKYRKPIEWPQFFEACRYIAEKEQIAPFDVDLSTPESLTCLVLEIWASIQDQVGRDAGEDAAWPVRDRPHRQDGPPDWSLRDLVGQFPHSLYLALAHLVGTCTHLRSKHRVMQRRHLSERAVASRHWYHTAASQLRKTDQSGLTLLQLPGRWSTRGDWMLAVAHGSRSKVRGHRALDLLSSRRMNLVRFQDGLGLPVRDILPDSAMTEIPSAIYSANRDTKSMSAITYGEICDLGVAFDKKNFTWLWRSRIRHFARDSFYFRRWIARMFEERDWLDASFFGYAPLALKVANDLEKKLVVSRRKLTPSRPRISVNGWTRVFAGGNYSNYENAFWKKHGVLFSALQNDIAESA